MKTLYLVRHAKSSWDDPTLDDTDRPLKTSGVNDAYIMAAFLKEKKAIPDLILSSPAVRALSTAVIFTNQLGVNNDKIKISRNLYESTPGDILNVISKTDPGINSLMIFGHDPILTNLFTLLTGENIEKIPTSAVASISIPVDLWEDLAQATGILDFLLKPKGIKHQVK